MRHTQSGLTLGWLIMDNIKYVLHRTEQFKKEDSHLSDVAKCRWYLLQCLVAGTVD